MPRYDYRCKRCGEEFEAERPVAQRADVDCPTCGGDTMQVFRRVQVGGRGGSTHASIPAAGG